MKSRMILFILNILVAAICIAVILSFFVAPFWQVRVSYTITPETMKDLLKQAAESGSGEADDPLANLELTDEDYEQVVGGEGFQLSLALKLDTADMFASLSAGKERESVETLINANVNRVVGDIMPKVNALIKNAMPVVSKAVINQAISDQVEKALEGSGTSAKEVMEKAGFTEQYIADQTEHLVDAIYADNATVDTVADSVIDTVEDVFNKLQENEIEEFQDAELTEEAKAEIREQVKESLAMLADEDGNINADEFVADFILQGINQALGQPNGTSVAPKATLLADSATGEPSSEEQLKARLTELIMEKVDGGTVNTLVLVMRIIAGLILFTMFTWAYLIVKILVKLFCKNPGIKLALPIWLGWLPFQILVLVPAIAFLIIKSSPSVIASFAGAEAAATITGKLSAISISFASCTIVAAIGALLLFILFFFYRIPRKRLKKLKRMQRYNPNLTEADVR